MADESVEALIAKRFIARQDVKAVQATNGAYYPACDLRHRHDGTEGNCEYAKWTMTNIRDHVAGRRTYGHYLLNHKNICKFFCFDLDLDKEGSWHTPRIPHDSEVDNSEIVPIDPRAAWREDDPVVKPDLLLQLRTLCEGLALRVKKLLDIPVIMAYSGNKGMHVYGLTGADQAETIRACAVAVMEAEGDFARIKGEHFWKHQTPEDAPNNITVEVFPKQDSLDSKDFGNLMRLPLGIHQKSKKSAFFIDPNTPYEVLKPADPLETLLNGTVWAS